MTTKQTRVRNEKVGTLNELIQATRDSAEFYSDAARRVENPSLSALFDHMANSKNGLVGSMTKEVQMAGAEPAKSGTFRGSMRAIYDDSLALMGVDKSDFSYVDRLEKSEDRFMEAIHDVIKSDSAALEVKQSLSSYLPTVKKHHDVLRERKWAMEGKNTTH